MTARVVPKHEVSRLLDLLIARGLPPSSLIAMPGGRVQFNLTTEAANDDGQGEDLEAARREWAEDLSR